MSVVVSYKRQAVVFAVMAVIALAATEVAVRMLAETIVPECAFLSHYLYRDVPVHVKHDMCREYSNIKSDYDGRVYTPRPTDGDYVNIGKGGFRGTGPSTIGDDSYRIFMLGGSTTFGYVTLGDDLTIPALLEKKLRESGLDARVVNAGAGSSNTYDERYRAERYAEEWDPDMVIMYDGVNEILYQGVTYEEFLDVGFWSMGSGVGPRVPLSAGYERLVDTDDWGALNYSELQGGLNDSPPFNYSELQGGLNDSPPFNSSGDGPAAQQWGPGIGIARLAIWLDYRTALGAIEWLRGVTTPQPAESDRVTRKGDGGVLMGDPTPSIERSLHGNWAAVCRLGQDRGFITINFLQPHLGTADRKISEHEAPSLLYLQPFKYDPLTHVEASQFLSNVTLDPAKYHPCENVHDLRSTFDGMDDVTIYFDWHHMRGDGNDVVASAMYDIVRPLVADDLAVGSVREHGGAPAPAADGLG